MNDNSLQFVTNVIICKNMHFKHYIHLTANVSQLMHHNKHITNSNMKNVFPLILIMMVKPYLGIFEPNDSVLVW